LVLITIPSLAFELSAAYLSHTHAAKSSSVDPERDVCLVICQVNGKELEIVSTKGGAIDASLNLA
jgi:hypothetical protein